MPRIRSTIFLTAFALTAFIATTAPAKEKYAVTVSYVLSPERPLPLNVRSVAVTDSGVEAMDGGHEANRSRRWSLIAAQLIESMLQDAGQRGEAHLNVVQRSATKKILEEQDLRLAGIVEGPAAERAGKLLAVDGLVMSKITIHMDTRRKNKEVVDWTRMLGGGAAPNNRDPRFRRYDQPNRGARPASPRGPGGPVGGGGMDLPTKTISEINRNLTVQCSFALVDVTNGRSIVQFTPPVYQKTDTAKPNFMFSRCVDEADLDPVDHFIGELVERAARDFVSMLVPTKVSYNYELIGKGKHGEAAIRALRADNYKAAFSEFEQAHQEDPKRDWHVFGMGVTAELMGDPQRALELYREAASMAGVDKEDMPIYLAAKQRLTTQLPRIARAAPPPGEPDRGG